MIYGIFGCGGFGREILDWQRSMFAKNYHGGILCVEEAFVVSDDEEITQPKVNGVQVYRFSDYLKLNDGKINVAVSNPQGKERIAKQCVDRGLEFYNIIHATVDISPSSRVGLGAVFGPFVVVSCNTVVGKNVHANFHTVISHDCIIGDNVTLTHGVKLSGWNIVGDRAYFGVGSCVKNGSAKRPIRIGRDAVIGAGAVVLSDVPDGEVWAGVPAKKIK